MTVQISGDMLALDATVCQSIQQYTAALQARFPNDRIDLTAHIAEEFDPINGHRVRCELATAMTHRPHIMIRAAHKSAEAAISAAFSEMKKKFRQCSVRQSPAADLPIAMAGTA